MTWNKDHVGDKQKWIAELMGTDTTGMDAETAQAAGREAVLQLVQDLDQPFRLRNMQLPGKVSAMAERKRRSRPLAIKGIFHINVNCTDLDRSKAFYELLNFQTVLDLPAGGGTSMLRGLGLPPGSQLRGAIMMLDPDQPRSTRLDLLEWLQPTTWGRPYEDLAHVGAARIALWTIGLDEEMVRLRAAGVHFLSEPAEMAGRDTRFVCFTDPDGTVLELIEFGGSPTTAQRAVS